MIDRVIEGGYTGPRLVRKGVAPMSPKDSDDEDEVVAKDLEEAQRIFKDNHPHPENMSLLELMARVRVVDPRYANYSDVEFFCAAHDVQDRALGEEAYEEALRTDGQSSQVKGFLIGLLERKKIELLKAAGDKREAVRTEGDRFLRILFPNVAPNDP